MASGKTTFGRALARRTGWDFVDLDEVIERETGLSVAELMAREGEAAFRLRESLALKKTASLKKTVVACGGGTPCHRDNMEFMTLHGMTLWLVASPARIAERIALAGASRPVVAGKEGPELLEFVTSHLRARQPHYAKAFWRLSGEHLESETEIDAAVDAFLETDFRF